MGSAPDNVDVVRRAFTAADQQDRAELFSCLDPRVQWHQIGWLVDGATVRHGREEVWSYSEALHRRLDGLSNELSDPIEVGNQVVVRVRTHGRDRDSGEAVDVVFTTVFQLRDGRIASAENFEDHDEALTEAALRT